MNNAFVELNHVEIGYQKRGLLPPLSIKIKGGQFWGIVGPNGAGKSTLVKTILGILKPISGKRNLKPSLKIGYVAQQNQFSDHFPLSVYDIVSMGRYHLKKSKDQESIIEDSLDQMGMTQLKNKLFSDLSGGQKQRTLIARALAGTPNLLILDEPTSGMDLVGTSEMIQFLKGWQQKKDRSVVMITHTLSQLIHDATHLCLINHYKQQFLTGHIDEILTTTHLSKIYGVPLSVKTISGERYIFTGE